MKVIAVSQQVITRLEGRERCDALDQQWTVLLEQAGILPVLLPNRLKQVSSLLASLPISGLLLTGGNDLSVMKTESAAPERDVTESVVLSYAIEKQYPVLGVCRGAQFLVNFFGGRLRSVSHHAGTSHSLIIKSLKLGQLPSTVNSYHNFGFCQEDLPECLELIATSEDGIVEVIQHRTLPITGLMWHPEREYKQKPHIAMLLRKLFAIDL